jgi:hypothetical protein
MVTIDTKGDLNLSDIKVSKISDDFEKQMQKAKKKIEKEKIMKNKSIAVKFVNALTDIMASPISKYTTIGASFRYFG